MDSNDLLSLGKRLSELLVKLNEVDSEDDWQQVAVTARMLADGLRVRDGAVDNHTLLGKTSLPQTLSSLYQLALHGSAIPSSTYAPPITEILRVSANLCPDHDENREFFLDAGLPRALVSLLEAYAETVPSLPPGKPLPLSVLGLKVIRTAVGVLLNASVGYEPVKLRLISLNAGMTLLRLSIAIYPSGSWLGASAKDNAEGDEDLVESWTIRSTISGWVWRTLLELKDVKDETLQIFSSVTDALPLLTSALIPFTTHITDVEAAIFPQNSEMFSTLLQADFEVLEESCTQLESLSLDVEDVRLSLALQFQFPAEAGISCFATILQFIEKGSYSPFWQKVLGETDAKRKEKAFDICKAALIKTVVEVVGEDANEEVLWDDSEEDKPGGDFVSMMVRWLKSYVSDTENGKGEFVGRTDLAVCASLSLGNLARREKKSLVLLSPPHSLAPFLASVHLLSPDSDIKIKHGVLGFLKHLTQSASPSSPISSLLGQADLIRRICDSGVWDERTDVMAEVIQVSAIGVVRHMCNANVENTFTLVLPSSASQGSKPVTGLSQIMALVKRSDTVTVKSEGTRVLVNVIKSLWQNDIVGTRPDSNPSPDSEDRESKRQEAMQTVLTPQSASVLASLIGRSVQFPILVNEGVVALTLLSTQKTGAPMVLKAILSPLSFDTPPPPNAEPPSASSSVASDVSSPTVATPPSTRGRLPVPRTTLDILISVLNNVDNPVNFQVEVRINTCSLFIQMGKNSSGEDYDKVKETIRPVFERLLDSLKDVTGKDEILAKALRKASETWV
ncbi:hypothetical protein K435DRAFT_769285 [Dendrothele bispora CBS 962.96]|uniref:DUF1941-domain-containing protein n=1 Tax=Dendrothele bispora (strain CBS 962.96) TaxID=1314807 RepID=A0A4S8KS58_DENBC|nr:hypothetical protein K435DRAFT_769285 [Dendrothele bispora CBS 962.96]